MSVKSPLIEQYITLKREYQTLYFNHQEALKQIESMKQKIGILESKVENKECHCDKNIVRENQRLQAIVKQTRYSVVNTPTGKMNTSTKTPIKTHQKAPVSDGEYEVEELLEHRGRKPNRQFLVRWKHFSPKHDTWENEKNLKSCPDILRKYLKNHRLA